MANQSCGLPCGPVADKDGGRTMPRQDTARRRAERPRQQRRQDQAPQRQRQTPCLPATISVARIHEDPSSPIPLSCASVIVLVNR
jgi:hypothetical protein